MGTDFLDMLFETVDFLADKATVGLELGLTRTPGADARPKPLQVAPLPGQSRQEALALGKLHLQLAFAGAGTPGKDVQDEGNTVDDFDLKGFLKVVLLLRRQLIIEDSDVVRGLLFQFEQLFQLTLAEVVAPGGRAQVLNDFTNDFCASSFCQLRQLFD